MAPSVWDTALNIDLDALQDSAGNFDSAKAWYRVLRRILLCKSLEHAASEVVHGFKWDLLPHAVHDPDGTFFARQRAFGHSL